MLPLGTQPFPSICGCVIYPFHLLPRRILNLVLLRCALAYGAAPTYGAPSAGTPCAAARGVRVALLVYALPTTVARNLSARQRSCSARHRTRLLVGSHNSLHRFVADDLNILVLGPTIQLISPAKESIGTPTMTNWYGRYHVSRRCCIFRQWQGRGLRRLNEGTVHRQARHLRRPMSKTSYLNISPFFHLTTICRISQPRLPVSTWSPAMLFSPPVESSEHRHGSEAG